MNATITGPCGHTTDWELAVTGRDAYRCLCCGAEWYVHQDPPIVYASGWVGPGRRVLVLGSRVAVEGRAR